MKNIILKSCLIALCLICGLGNAWGEDITFDAASKNTSLNGVTLSVTDGTLTNGTDYRVYKNQTLTITSTVGNITNIAFTYSSASYDGGGWAASYQPNAATWTSPVANGEQARITKIVVTLSGQLLTHTAHFSINGTINDAYDCTVTEGSAITFPTGLADINGKKFVGWMEGTISGTADTAPDFVTSATMGTADITYNAVYATQGEGGGSGSADLTSSEMQTHFNATAMAYADDEKSWKDGDVTWSAKAYSTKDANYLQLRKNTILSYVKIQAPGAITSVSFNAKNASDNAFSGTIYLVTEPTSASSTNAVGNIASPLTDGNGTITPTGSNNTLYIQTSAGLRLRDIEITYTGGTTYSGYCTTVPTSGPTDASWTVTPDAVSVEVGKTATATIDTNYDGTLSVVSNDESKATVTINDKVITVTGVAAGTTTLTVTGAATSNFNAISKTIDVTVTASSATTPAFAYFEETATINIGEVLEAKDYCGTIASDAGFDDYSISTAVCSAIGAADGQKISDDYACIYSKVSFKKAGTYVVHVTAPAVAGKYTASEGYITVTVTGPTLYKVTIETPENGTLIVKHGDDIVESGDEFAKDERLDITVTPDEGYKFRNWQAVDNTTRTYTTSFKYIIGESDVTISANFDELATYAINFSINGNIATQNLKEGADVTVPTAEEVNAARPTGVTKVFTGWVTSEESVDANETPTYVIPATTAISNITYYAVFATKTGEGEGEGGDYKLVEEDLGTAWAGQYLIAYSNDVFADGRVGGTDGLGKAQSHVDPDDALSSDKKTVTAAWGDEYYVTLEKISDNSNTYVLKTQDNEYNYQTTNKNGLSSSENKSTAAAYPISITFNGRNDIDLALGGNATGAVFHYNNNSGTSGEMFRFYKDGGQQNIYLYKKSATTGGATYSDFTTLVSCEISISQYGATSFSVPRNYTMPTGITGKTITANKKVDSLGDGYYKLTYSADYEEGSVVPAGESLVLYGEQGNYTIIYEGTPEKTLKEGNLLHGVYEAKDGKFLTTYDKEHSGSYYYYKLTTQSGENFGWYYGATEGAPFLMSRDDRAYLVIEKEIAAGIRGFALEDGEEEDLTTGIDNMETNSTNSIYNLQGLQQSKLQKGINIVNGKKVIR